MSAITAGAAALGGVSFIGQAGLSYAVVGTACLAVPPVVLSVMGSREP